MIPERWQPWESPDGHIEPLATDYEAGPSPDEYASDEEVAQDRRRLAAMYRQAAQSKGRE